MPISTSVFDPELIPALWFDLGLGSWFDPDLTAPPAPDTSVHGVGNNTLAALTGTATGKVAIKGTRTGALAALTTTGASGKVAIKGTRSGSLAALVTTSALGKVAIKGTRTGTLAALTTTVKTGKVAVKGSGNNTLGGVSTTSALGKVAIKGTRSGTLAPLLITAASVAKVKGSGSVVLGSLTSTGIAKALVRAHLAAALADAFDESDRIHHGTSSAGRVLIL